MKLFVVLLSLAWLPACATRNRAVGAFADGSVAQEIDCTRDHPEKCVQRARRICEPFGREPQTIRPLLYNEIESRWTTVITCGPPTGPLAPPGMAYRPAGPPPPAGGPPPAGTFTPLPPEYPPSSNRPQ